MALIPFGVGGAVATVDAVSRLYNLYDRAYNWLGPDGRQFVGDAVGNFTQSLGEGFQIRAKEYAREKNAALVRVPPRAAAVVPAQRALGGALYAPMYTFRRYRRYRRFQRRYRRRFGYRRYRRRRYSAFRYV